MDSFGLVSFSNKDSDWQQQVGQSFLYLPSQAFGNRYEVYSQNEFNRTSPLSTPAKVALVALLILAFPITLLASGIGFLLLSQSLIYQSLYDKLLKQGANQFPTLAPGATVTSTSFLAAHQRAEERSCVAIPVKNAHSTPRVTGIPAEEVSVPNFAALSPIEELIVKANKTLSSFVRDVIKTKDSAEKTKLLSAICSAQIDLANLCYTTPACDLSKITKEERAEKLDIELAEVKDRQRQYMEEIHRQYPALDTHFCKYLENLSKSCIALYLHFKQSYYKIAEAVVKGNTDVLFKFMRFTAKPILTHASDQLKTFINRLNLRIEKIGKETQTTNRMRIALLAFINPDKGDSKPIREVLHLLEAETDRKEEDASQFRSFLKESKKIFSRLYQGSKTPIEIPDPLHEKLNKLLDKDDKEKVIQFMASHLALLDWFDEEFNDEELIKFIGELFQILDETNDAFVFLESLIDHDIL